MNTNNPATPAAPVAPATPGNDPKGSNPPSTTAAPVVPEGKVILSTEEFSKLSRDAARGRSAQRRADLGKTNRAPAPSDSGTSDPAAKAIQEANERAEEAERQALQIQVKDRVRDIFNKDEFKNIPKSTQTVILNNPGLLSTADNLEEALLDVEDYLRDTVLPLDIGIRNSDTPPAPQPAGVQTPPANPGSPAPAKPAGQIDTSNLRGTDRSVATIKNLISSKTKQ